MSAKIYSWVLRGGIILSLLTVFLIFKGLLFPFITSKQLVFNILIEGLAAVWLILIARYPEYRPRYGYIAFGLIAYFAVMLISCFTGVDFNLSFWGDAERMLGWFHLLHFLAFYLILTTVFRTWKDWRSLFMFSVAAATAVSLIGLMGANVYSTIGNTAYVSGYLIFNLFFCLLLFFRSRQLIWRWLYALPVAVMLAEFWACRTSGAIIGLFFGLWLFVFLSGWLARRRVWRRTVVIVSAALIVLVLTIFSQSQAAWFQASFLKNLTFQKATFQTRLISWRGAAADFKDHPFFGTGLGNYAIIFDKHFDPKFYSYATTDTYFDRAHNNLIDIVSTTGVIGLLAYLSIFAAALYYLIRELRAWRRNRQDGVSRQEYAASREIALIFSLLAAYFIQNLAVFDSLVTYLGLMIILGFINWRTSSASGESAADNPAPAESRPWVGGQWETVVLIILLAISFLFVRAYNLKFWRMFSGVISGYAEILDGKIAAGTATYKAALSGTPLDRDGRATYISLVAANPVLLQYLEASDADSVLTYAISLAEKNVALSPHDSLIQLQLAQITDTMARFNFRNTFTFNRYLTASLEAIDKSIAASPGRVPLYLTKSQIFLMSGNNEKSIQAAEYAIGLNPDYYEGYCRLSQIYYLLKDEKLMGNNLDECLEKGGLSSLESDLFLQAGITSYIGRKDYVRALVLNERLVQLFSTDAANWLSLAKLYLANGDMERAEAAAQEAISLDKDLQTEWDSVLKAIQAAAKKATK